MIRVVLGTPMFLGGVIAFILDNTVPGKEPGGGGGRHVWRMRGYVYFVIISDNRFLSWAFFPTVSELFVSVFISIAVP